MTLREQFESMEVGDKIWVEGNRAGWSVHTFVRTTKTLLVTSFRGTEYKFGIGNGYKKGTDRWTHITAKPFTEVHSDIVEKYKLKRKAQRSLEKLTSLVNKGKLREEDVNILVEIEGRHV
ncbi:hypothetical protein NVP1063O_003 [Vibrio phage 1.063.O._10N.261.45.C7]|nr:hypothetical protein NVP1063O_003 [Vibrio phage 1.063.O._10N.261.45.C7]